MIQFFQSIFDSDFMPHGGCYLWRPDLVWLHAVSDFFIFTAYTLIPFALVRLVRQRKDLVFNWMFVMFGLFIMACGVTHLLEIWNIWHAAYRLSGVVKAITAAASLSTAYLLFRLVPQAVALPSPAQLRLEVAERKRAEAEVRALNATLEGRIEERTATLARSNAALQRFAYVASHDLQEPIRTVRAFNQLLSRDYSERLDEDGNKYVGYIIDASARMQTLVDDLLTYARSIDQDREKQIRPVDADTVLHGVLKNLNESIRESDAEIISDGLPEVNMDATQCAQIFQNLLANAIKYRETSRPLRIYVQAECEGNQWLFSVRDNGIGIHSRYWDQIFMAFKRLHGREFPGSGIGLTICRDIVETYGGRIWVESTPGEGSTFKFTLPAVKSEVAVGAA